MFGVIKKLNGYSLINITVEGINRSLDMFDSVFVQNEVSQVVLSPLAFEFKLPTPIFEVIPGLECQFPQGASLTVNW